MARSLNGTSDRAICAAGFSLSSVSIATIAFWMWANNTTGSQAGFTFDTNPANNTGAWSFFWNSGGNPIVFIANSAASAYWQDHFARPSTGAWHHYMIAVNRATPLNAVWVDGVAQTLTSDGHNAGSYGNFGSNTLTIGAQLAAGGTANSFLSGKFAEFTCWSGVQLTTKMAAALAAGASPFSIRPANIILHAPLLGGNSPEPDFSGNRRSFTLTGTSAANHPGIHRGVGAIL